MLSKFETWQQRKRQPQKTHPEVGAVLLPGHELLEGDADVGDEHIGRDGSVVENGQRQRLGVLHLMLEILVPNGVERLLFGGRLCHVGVVHIDGHVGVQRLLVRLTEGMPLGAVRRPKVLSLAQFYAYRASEHGRALITPSRYGTRTLNTTTHDRRFIPWQPTSVVKLGDSSKNPQYFHNHDTAATVRLTAIESYRDARLLSALPVVNQYGAASDAALPSFSSNVGTRSLKSAYRSGSSLLIICIYWIILNADLLTLE